MNVNTPHVVRRTANRTLEQMGDLTLKDTIGAPPDGVEVAVGFQHLVAARDGKSSIGPEEPHQVTIRISRDHRLQYLVPSIGAVDLAGAQGAAFKMAELVEDEERVIAHAAEVTVPGGALLCAVGRADGTVHVQCDPGGRVALVNPVDPMS